MKKKYIKNLDIQNAGHAVVNYITNVIKDQKPEYLEFIPFKIGYCCNYISEGTFYCLHIKEIVSQIPHYGTLKDIEIINLSKKIFNINPFPPSLGVDCIYIHLLKT